MKNKTKHGLVTGLTALSTVMICQTSMTYASDIEIYKAPTTGGANLMLILDESASMAHGESSQTPITNDFKANNNYWCQTPPSSPNKTDFQNQRGYYFDETHNLEYEKEDKSKESYSYTGRYCLIDKSVVDGLSNTLNKTNFEKGCTLLQNYTIKRTVNSSGSGAKIQYYVGDVTVPARDVYKCSDRRTALKKSLAELIGNADNLPNNTVIGMTVFPNHKTLHDPVTLDDEGRIKLLKKINSFGAGTSTPIAQGYSYGASELLKYMSTAANQCAGYGVYFLTDGEPRSDSFKGSTSATSSAYLNKYLDSDSQLTYDEVKTGSGKNQKTEIIGNCTDSWECLDVAAGYLANKKHSKKLEVKTAVVGFGSEFSFKDVSGNNILFSKNYTKSDVDNLFSTAFQKAAAKAAISGKGGWFSADNTADIVNSVQKFVESVKVPIPVITTGTAAIPQDRLNPIVIQSYAYFPQFQPKPSEDFEAWFGNLKKFSVKDGVLVGQDDEKVFGADGALKSATKDFWVNGASADWVAYGGLLSKLNLQTFTNGTDFARKVFTNAGGSIQKVNLEYMQEKIATGNNKYLLGALGYDLTETELDELAALDSLELTNLANRKQNRSIGAIMHSTPVLLTQSGKITYSDTKKSNETVDRDDYILFGTTQGALHVVKTGREADTYEADDTPADYDGGKEIFTFIPEEILAAQPKALLSEPNTTGNGMDHLYYGIDGAWTAHTEYVYNKSLDKFEVNPSSGKKGKQWVYGGMRMGGSSYYALDLTDIDSPTVKFRIDPAAKTISDVDSNGDPIEGTERTVGYVYKNGSTTGTPYTDLAKMGQSWSKPTIAYVQWKGQRKLVMIVGGGYDPEYEDFRTGKSAKGAGIYMFDADTGDLLWTTYDASGGDEGNLEYSVVSQIKAVDREGDGDVDHLYFGDLGGQVFRIDLKSDHASSDSKADFGKVTRLADFKETGKYAPRFYEMPAFSIYRNATGMFAVLSIGSGNRSTPLLGKVIDSQYVTPDESDTENQKLLNDAIYNIYDLAVTDTNPANSTKGPLSIGRSNLQQITDEDRELASDEDQAGEDYNENSSYKGWYYEFPSSASISNRKAVEKVQSDLVLLDSDLYVSTFDAEGVGSEEACGAGIYGSSRAHRFCMPYGQCGAGDTVEDNTMTLGKGLLGITLGQSTDANGVPYRSIIGPVENRNPTSNKILNTLYRNKIKLTPYSWYERN
ncbi:pilus assembly protein [Acinetobacter variabilis]|uniref:pilus assembly protein n=1 Tax=Acinetobacter variabilis TaxID=70346 RepID=UPI003D771C36